MKNSIEKIPEKRELNDKEVEAVGGGWNEWPGRATSPMGAWPTGGMVAIGSLPMSSTGFFG